MPGRGKRKRTSSLGRRSRNAVRVRNERDHESSQERAARLENVRVQTSQRRDTMSESQHAQVREDNRLLQNQRRDNMSVSMHKSEKIIDYVRAREEVI